LRYQVLKEPPEAPEPRYEWILCKPCHAALLAEMRRSSIRSPVRLRVAMGLVAAERSPRAYTSNSVSAPAHEQQEFQREFVWAMRLLILFAIWHLVILVILFAVPK
jgi:hypothetical protein